MNYNNSKCTFSVANLPFLTQKMRNFQNCLSILKEIVMLDIENSCIWKRMVGGVTNDYA